MPAGGDVDVGVGDFGVVLEDAAGTGEGDAGLKIPEGVAVEVGACGVVLLVSWGGLNKWARSEVERRGLYRLASGAAMGVLASSISARLC